MQIMKDIGGVEMPEYFGKLIADEDGGGKAKSSAPEPKADDTEPDSADDAPKPEPKSPPQAKGDGPRGGEQA